VVACSSTRAARDTGLRKTSKFRRAIVKNREGAARANHAATESGGEGLLVRPRMRRPSTTPRISSTS
jgi:hypothetical protein